MMIEIADKELQLKEKSIDVLQRSLEQSESAIRVMSESIVQVGNCMKEGMALLAQSFSYNNNNNNNNNNQTYQLQLFNSPPMAPYQNPQKMRTMSMSAFGQEKELN